MVSDRVTSLFHELFSGLTPARTGRGSESRARALGLVPRRSGPRTSRARHRLRDQMRPELTVLAESSRRYAQSSPSSDPSRPVVRRAESQGARAGHRGSSGSARGGHAPKLGLRRRFASICCGAKAPSATWVSTRAPSPCRRLSRPSEVDAPGERQGGCPVPCVLASRRLLLQRNILSASRACGRASARSIA